MTTLVLPVVSLWWREIVRFVRQRSRVTGSIAQPLGFWLMIGAGLGGSFRPGGEVGGASYLEYVYPGTIIMILLFTAIFSTISVIEDRREGFLQSVLVAPIPRSAIVLGKLLGGTTLAVLEAILFLAIAPLLGFTFTLGSALALLAMLVALGFGLTALGFVIAWRMDSTAGFHAIMNLLLLPMWLLSGALFPVQGAMTPLRWVMAINPLTYGLAILRRLLYIGRPIPGGELPAMMPSLVVTLAFALAIFGVAVAVSRGRSVVEAA